MPEATTCAGSPVTIAGTEQADSLFGTAGNDVISGAGGDDRIIGLAGDDKLCGDEGNDFILGQAGNDTILGGPDSDALLGGSGDDQLNGGGGVGPQAIDFASFQDATGPVVADLRMGRATGDGTDSLTGIDSLIGSRFDDRLSGDDAINSFSGEEGNDVIDGGGGFDLAQYDYGATASLASGTTSGVQGTDQVSGIEGLSGATSVQLAGDDAFTGDGGANYLAGGSGNDTLAGGAGDDREYGDAGNDVVRGDAGDDLVSGEAGDDTLDGGAGVFDAVSYLSAAQSVNVNLASGNATGQGNDIVRGAEAVSGSTHDDVIAGDAAANSLAGNAGNDVVAGGAASDFLGGGTGSDTLAGGGGSDYCLAGERGPKCEITGVPGKLPGGAAQPPVGSARRGAVSARAVADVATRPLGVPATTRIESIELTYAQLRACGRRCGPTPPAGAAADAASSASRPPADLLPDAFRHLEETAQGDGTADFEYWGVPACFSSRRPFATSITPPRQVEPVGTDNQAEEAWWEAKLFQYDKRRRQWKMLRKTSWARAAIAGPYAVPGLPVWQDPERKSFTPALRVTVPAGRYAWGAQLFWTRTSKSVYGWVEPHVDHGAATRHAKWCVFG